LQAHFNPQVEQALAQTAELLTADVAYLESVTKEVYERAIAVHEEMPCLDRSVLKSVPLAIRRRVIRQFLQRFLSASPRFEQIENLVSLIDAPNRSQSEPLPGGAIVQVRGTLLVLIAKS
jgi:tRNA(Ile)-lysidine synthase